MTAESTLTLPPSADLPGSWQKTAPLPIDSGGFVTPTLAAWAAASYSAGDANADGTQESALTLPDIEGLAVASDIELVGIRSVAHNNYTTATRTITLPTGIQASDLILIFHGFWTDFTGSAPSTPSGYTRRFSNKNSPTYSPRFGLDWKVASGSESGQSVTITLAASHPVTLCAVVYRGVDPASPFDAADGPIAYASGANPNPPAVTSVTDGAVVITGFAQQDGSSPQPASPPSGYTELFDAAATYGTRRGLNLAAKLVPTAGSEDPGAFTVSSTQLSSSVTVVLRPSTSVDTRTLIVVAGSADETGSASSSSFVDGYSAVIFDDFATTGTYDGGAFGGNWSAYDSAGNAGNGLRRTTAVSIVNSTTQPLLAGDPPVSNGTAAQIAATWDGSNITSGIVQLTGEPITYGRVRFRTKATGDPSAQVSPVVLMWPDDDDWPGGGEIDIAEGIDAMDDLNPMKSFLHRENPSSPGNDQQLPALVWALPDIAYDAAGTDWHTYELVWLPDQLVITVDDSQTQTMTLDPAWIPSVPMKFSIQLDAWGNSALSSDVFMWVDWVFIEEATFATGAPVTCVLDGRDEVQTITSVLGSGTFTLTLDGQTTGSIAFDASAATVQAALEALSNVSVGDVRCDGGDLDTAPINIEFDNGWGAQNVPLMSASSGSVTVTEGTKGYAAETFNYAGDVNVPRAGGAMEPQMFAWHLTPAAGYMAGRTITFDASDHDSLKSWAAVLQVWADLNTSSPIETFGTEVTGTGSAGDVGAITPATQGSLVQVIAAKALASGNYSTPNGMSAVALTVPGGAALADSMSLDLMYSPPVAATAIDLGRTSWSGSELFTLGAVSLRPATPPSTGLDLWEVIDDELVTDWIDLATASGSLEEYIEVDTTGLPSDAYVTGLTVEFAHSADALHRLQVLPVGIDGSGAPTVAAQVGSGFTATPLGSTVTVTGERVTEFPDGSIPANYDRFGLALRSQATQVGLSTHKLFWARLVIDYLAGGPVISNVAGPDVAGDPITWDYSSASGFPMSHYRVLVIAGSSQDPAAAAAAGLADNFVDVTTGDVIYDSGMVPSSSARSLSIGDWPLAGGSNTVAVKAWASVNGILIESDWGVDNFAIAGTAPTAPTVAAAPTLNPATGVIEMEIDTGSAQSRAWVLRSEDGGTVFRLANSNPFTITASSSGQELFDDDAPLVAGLVWRVAVDNGPMTEASVTRLMNGSAYDATPSFWYLKLPGDPDSNLRLEVAKVEMSRPRKSVIARRPSGSITASSSQMSWEFNLGVRTRSADERAALEVLLGAGVPLRLSDILGRSWLVSPVDDASWSLQRWRATPSESTAMRDAHVIDLKFVEVTSR